MSRFLWLPAISFLATLLPAQQSVLNGPVEGYAFDAPTRSFRAVIGFPGSAALGPSIAEGFDFGSVAPRKDYALAFKENQCTFISGFDSGNVTEVAIPGAFAQPDGVAWSTDGSLAVLFSRSGAWLQKLAISSSRNFSAPVDLSVLGPSLSAITIDAQGRQVAVGIAGETGGAFLLTDSDALVPLLPGSKPVSLAFSTDGSKLFVLDGGAFQLTELRLADSTSQAFSLDGLTDPVAVKSYRDGANRQVLLVASRGDYLLRAYDVASREVLTEITLDFQARSIEDFGRSSFLLAPRSKDGEPIWLFTSAPRQAVYFVPATPLTSGGAR